MSYVMATGHQIIIVPLSHKSPEPTKSPVQSYYLAGLGSRTNITPRCERRGYAFVSDVVVNRVSIPLEDNRSS